MDDAVANTVQLTLWYQLSHCSRIFEYSEDEIPAYLEGPFSQDRFQAVCAYNLAPPIATSTWPQMTRPSKHCEGTGIRSQPHSLRRGGWCCQ
jgi:hypothetical protein